MTQAAISMIVARSRNHVIGKDNQMPWKISADLQFFKRVTMGHPVIMGRKTWESIGRPLPGRRNIVVNRLSDSPRVFVIGGEQLFRQSFAKADRLYLTEIDIDIVDGDTFFEIPDPENWQEIEKTPGSEGDIHFRFITLERK